MRQPAYLSKGSRIGITCPSGYVAAERISFAKELMELWGFKVRIGKTVGSAFHYFSGNDEVRLDDLQEMLDDPEIDAIFMGRGGYGLSRIIDQIDFSRFVKHPKWICGFSDITLLHNHIHAQFGIPTLHSPMGIAFKPETANADYIQSFYAALTGESLFYHAAFSEFNKIGVSEGVLIGGNLALLVHLIGTKSDVHTDGKILFIEDIGEHLYQIDRMMVQLKRSGKLDNLKGLIVGSFTELEDTERPFGQCVEEIILDKVKGLNYPVCFNFPCGHQVINFTLTLGEVHKLTVGEKSTELELSRVRST